MESLLRSHPNTSASLQYIAEAQRSLINPACLADTAELTTRYGISLRFHPSPTPIPIDCLWITPYGRFGNLMRQIEQAVDTARRFGVPKIFFELRVQEAGVFQESRSCTIDGIELFAATFARPTEHECVLYGTFWSLHDLGEPERPLPPPDVMSSRHFIEVLSDDVREPAAEQGDDDVVVHFRGGDVFHANHPPTHYAQPPLAFYITALRASRRTAEGTVHLVYEDMTNPVVSLLIDWLRASDIPFTEQSGALKDDLRVMLAAHTIVASFGTFVPGVMKVSHNIRRVYSFDNSEVYQAWFCYRRDIELHEYTDRSGTYIARGEWRVTAEQLDMMRTFAADNIVPRSE